MTLYRSNRKFAARRWFKAGDHPNEYCWSDSVPIIGEEPAKPWPDSGRLAKLAECRPETLHYSIFDYPPADPRHREWWTVLPGWWVLEENGVVTGTLTPEAFAAALEPIPENEERKRND